MVFGRDFTGKVLLPSTGDAGLDNTESDNILNSGQLVAAGLVDGSSITQTDPVLVAQGVSLAGPIGDVFIPSSGSEVF